MRKNLQTSTSNSSARANARGQSSLMQVSDVTKKVRVLKMGFFLSLCMRLGVKLRLLKKTKGEVYLHGLHVLL